MLFQHQDHTLVLLFVIGAVPGLTSRSFQVKDPVTGPLTSEEIDAERPVSRQEQPTVPNDPDARRTVSAKLVPSDTTSSASVF